jgi:hypothetical protein
MKYTGSPNVTAFSLAHSYITIDRELPNGYHVTRRQIPEDTNLNVITLFMCNVSSISLHEYIV